MPPGWRIQLLGVVFSCLPVESILNFFQFPAQDLLCASPLRICLGYRLLQVVMCTERGGWGHHSPLRTFVLRFWSSLLVFFLVYGLHKSDCGINSFHVLLQGIIIMSFWASILSSNHHLTPWEKLDVSIFWFLELCLIAVNSCTLYSCHGLFSTTCEHFAWNSENVSVSQEMPCMRIWNSSDQAWMGQFCHWISTAGMLDSVWEKLPSPKKQTSLQMSYSI